MKNDTKTLYVYINKFGWMVKAVFMSDETIDFKECKNFKVLEASDNCPHKIGSTIILSKNELKYYRISGK